MIPRFARFAVAAVGLAIGVVAVFALREATLSTHQAVPDDTASEVVLSARTRGGETNQTLAEMVEAVLLTCRLEVASDLAGPLVDEGAGSFRASLTPGLDETNRRQYRGCVEDWSVDHVLVDVRSVSPPVDLAA